MSQEAVTKPERRQKYFIYQEERHDARGVFYYIADRYGKPVPNGAFSGRKGLAKCEAMLAELNTKTTDPK